MSLVYIGAGTHWLLLGWFLSGTAFAQASSGSQSRRYFAMCSNVSQCTYSSVSSGISSMPFEAFLRTKLEQAGCAPPLEGSTLVTDDMAIATPSSLVSASWTRQVALPQILAGWPSCSLPRYVRKLLAGLNV